MPRQLLIFKACCPKKGLSFNLQPGKNCIDLCRVFFVLKGQKMGDSNFEESFFKRDGVGDNLKNAYQNKRIAVHHSAIKIQCNLN